MESKFYCNVIFLVSFFMFNVRHVVYNIKLIKVGSLWNPFSLTDRTYFLWVVK